MRLGETIVETIDVESDRVDAFTTDDVQFLQECAQALTPLWANSYQEGREGCEDSSPPGAQECFDRT